MVANPVMTMTIAGGLSERAHFKISKPRAVVFSKYKSEITNSGERLLTASKAAWPLVNGKTSCPSLRSNSATICTIVASSSTKSTRAMRRKLMQNLFQASWIGFPSLPKLDCARGGISGLAWRIDDIAHLEDRQEHGHNHAANHNAQEN